MSACLHNRNPSATWHRHCKLDQLAQPGNWTALTPPKKLHDLGIKNRAWGTVWKPHCHNQWQFFSCLLNRKKILAFLNVCLEPFMGIAQNKHTHKSLRTWSCRFFQTDQRRVGFGWLRSNCTTQLKSRETKRSTIPACLLHTCCNIQCKDLGSMVPPLCNSKSVRKASVRSQNMWF